MCRPLLAGVLLLPSLMAQTATTWRALDDMFLQNSSSAYDLRRGRLVVFGEAGEIWEFDGDRRLHRAVVDGGPTPLARTNPQLVYDEVRGHVLLFGGLRGNALGDTWIWD